MDVLPFHNDILTADADVIVIGIASDLQTGPYGRVIDDATGGVLRRLIDCGEITGEALESTLVLAPSGLAATHLVIVGTGEPDAASSGMAFRAAACAARTFSNKERSRVLFAFDGMSGADLTQAAVDHVGRSLGG